MNPSSFLLVTNSVEGFFRSSELSTLVGEIPVETTKGLDSGTTGRLCSLAVIIGFAEATWDSVIPRKLYFGLSR